MATASMQDWFLINELFTRYATSLDRCDLEAVVGCFSEHGSLQSPLLGRFEGAAGIRDFALRTARVRRDHGTQFRHVWSNLRVDVDGGRARHLLPARLRHPRRPDRTAVAGRVRVRAAPGGRRLAA